MSSVKKIYFFEHAHLRDRHLDTIRNWPAEEVINHDILKRARARQVPRGDALRGLVRTGWKQKIPVINLKSRPSGIPDDAIVYVWGGLVATGRFIVDLDTPYALFGYNLRAVPFWRRVIARMLLSDRCLEIRCMSEACRQTLRRLFGARVAEKARVHYPIMEQHRETINKIVSHGSPVRFLFVGTQFEIKGGGALLRAWIKAARLNDNMQLDIVSHVPEHYAELVESAPGVNIHEAKYSRAEIWNKFMQHADVLLLPTYVESFGMVALEALSFGMAIIATDIYALPEMVNKKNGALISPPIEIWKDYLAFGLHFRLNDIAEVVRSLDTEVFENNLADEICKLARSKEALFLARQASVTLFKERFISNAPTC